MSKLKKYTNFEALKADETTDKAAFAKGNKLLLEFEAFLNSLRRQFSTNQQAKGTHGKQIS